jgi:hypothetical protein
MFVALVLRRPDAAEQTEISDSLCTVGDVIQVGDSRWLVVAEEPPDRVGITARYVCVPAESP